MRTALLVTFLAFCAGDAAFAAEVDLAPGGGCRCDSGALPVSLLPALLGALWLRRRR